MKHFRKILCTLLAVIMAVSVCLIPASAMYSENNSYDEIYPELSALESGNIYPTIVLPGINHSDYYLADDEGNVVTNAEGEEMETGLLMLDTDNLTNRILSVVPSLLASIFTKKDINLSDKIGDLVSSLFRYMSTDENGDSNYNLITKTYNCPLSKMDDDTRDMFYRCLSLEPVAETCGEDNIYIYTYPLIGDPMESAEGLDDYIEMVLEQTGAEKVNLAPVSLGGTILTAYMDIGKHVDKISKIVGVVALLDGTTLMSDFFLRKFDLSDENLYLEYFPNMMEQLTGSDTLGWLIDIGLRLIPRNILNTVLTSAFSAILDNVIVYNPQFWAMLPKADYDACVEKYLTSSVYAGLKEKTDRFQQARLNLEDNLKEFVANGGNVYTLSGCNLKYTDGEYAYFGIVASNGINCDGIIPTVSTSLGATCASSTEVDPSTCLFPTHAWFFDSQHHEIGGNDVALRLVACLISEKVTDINSSSAFPQFLTARHTKSLTRIGEGYIDIAKNAAYSDAYTDEQKAIIASARAEAVSLIADTSSTDAQLTVAADKLSAALNCEEYTEEEETASNKVTFSTIGTVILKWMAKILLTFFGGKGFLG